MVKEKKEVLQNYWDKWFSIHSLLTDHPSCRLWTGPHPALLSTFDEELSEAFLFSHHTGVGSIICQRAVVDGEEAFVAYTLKDVPKGARERTSMASPTFSFRWRQKLTAQKGFAKCAYVDCKQHFWLDWPKTEYI